MKKERFELAPGKGLMWTVTDNENHIAIDFREGLFNESQGVKLLEGFTCDDAPTMARIKREIGEWMAENHADVAISDWKARRSAIWKLSNSNYWLTLAAVTNSLQLSEKDADNAAGMLYAEVCYWSEFEKNVGLTAAEEENLKGVLSELTDSEAWEVFKILHVFWNNRAEDIDIYQLVMDMIKSDINTLYDLREFLIEYCKVNPEDDCGGLVCDICEEKGWVYTDYSDLEYAWEDYAYDGKNILSRYGNEWDVSKMKGIDTEYKGRDFVVREDDENFYIKYELSNRGCFYPKSDWELEKALEDYANTYEEK